ncbi:unnamed protein product, partial [Symbiodinium sp. CCMP2592]
AESDGVVYVTDRGLLCRAWARYELPQPQQGHITLSTLMSREAEQRERKRHAATPTPWHITAHRGTVAPLLRSATLLADLSLAAWTSTTPGLQDLSHIVNAPDPDRFHQPQKG